MDLIKLRYDTNYSPIIFMYAANKVGKTTVKVYESRYVAHLAMSGSKRETTNQQAYAFFLPTN